MTSNTSLNNVWHIVSSAMPDTLEALGDNDYLAQWWKPVPLEAVNAFRGLNGIRLNGEPFEPEQLSGGLAVRFSIAKTQPLHSSTYQLIRDLGNPDFRQSGSAREQLISMGANAVEALLDALPAASTKQRWEIFNIFAKIGDARPVPIVADYLKSGDGAIRLAAAQCLGIIGDKRATLPLIEAINSQGDSSALVWMVQALGRLRDKRATDTLLKVMQETDSSSIRYTAIEALGVIGATEAIDAIRACLADESHHVRSRAQTALELLDAQVAVRLIST